MDFKLAGGTVRRYSLGKSKRLASSKSFKSVMDTGLHLRNKLLALYMARNCRGHVRLGISVSKSLGNAVVRNRLKRLLREAFRQVQDEIPAGFDYVLMYSAGALKDSGPYKGLPSFEQVKSAFLALVMRAKKHIGE